MKTRGASSAAHHAATGALIVAAYERVSTRMQGASGFSLGAQEKDATAFALEHGWELPDHLRFRDGEDRAASGADWDLEGLNAAMDAAKRHEYQVLIVPDPDRFARSYIKGRVLEEQFQRHGVRVVYIRLPVEDTAEGRLQKNMMFSFAEYEREKIKFRTMRGRREKAERGMVVGAGPVPYGYRYVRSGERSRVVSIEPNPHTAPIVAQMFRDALRQSGIEIANGLRQTGAPPRLRKPWSAAGVYGILTNPVYSGRFVYGASKGRLRAEAMADRPEKLTTVAVPAIVDVSLWDAVQVALVRRRSQRRGRAAPDQDQFILRGLLSCGHCGGALSTFWNRGRATAQRIRYYKCIRGESHRAGVLGKALCAMRDVRAEPLEELVWQMVATTLLDPEQLRKGLNSARARHDEASATRAVRLQVIDREVATQRKRLERIVDEMLDTEKGSASYIALAQRQQVAEDVLRKLQAQRSEQAAEPTEGLSAGQALDLEQFAADVGLGIDKATQAERRWVYDRLRLRGTLRLEPDGLKIGQRHNFDLEFEAVIPIANSAANTKNKLTVYPTVARFLRLHLMGESPSGSIAAD